MRIAEECHGPFASGKLFFTTEITEGTEAHPLARALRMLCGLCGAKQFDIADAVAA
jgi:hypothetical protein